MVYGVTTVINSSQGQIKRDCRAHINYKWFDNVDCRDKTFYDGLKDSHWSEFCKLTSGWPLKGVKNWYGPFLKEKNIAERTAIVFVRKHRLMVL